MKDSTLLILAAGGAAALFLMRGRLAGTAPATAAIRPDVKRLIATTGSTIGKRLTTSITGNGGQAATAASKGGGAAPSMGAKDYVKAGAAVGAVAGCNAVPGVGTALSPLCGAAGNYLGGKAYDLGKDAWNEVSSWF